MERLLLPEVSPADTSLPEWRHNAAALLLAASAAYLLIFLASVAPHGPYAHVGLVVNPILVLVLCGSRPAKIAGLASLLILASTPFLRVMPGIRAFAADSAAGPSRHPEKLKELQNVFWVEARKYQVLPLDGRLAERLNPALRLSLIAGRTTVTYYDPRPVRLEHSNEFG